VTLHSAEEIPNWPTTRRTGASPCHHVEKKYDRGASHKEYRSLLDAIWAECYRVLVTGVWGRRSSPARPTEKSLVR
jgi:hypothetical protein